MKKNKLFILISTIVLIMMMLFGCDMGSDESQSESSSSSSPTTNKITKLQDVINKPEVQNGTITEINLSEYPDIIDYNATINKSIKITDTKSKNLTGATLKVVSDGVTLTGIQGASVKTQSSLKISGSSLSSLSVSTLSSPNANQISGRGTSDNTEIAPPTVEITDGSSVTNTVTVAIENAQIVANNLTAGVIDLDAMNTQLTIKGQDNSINKFKTNKVCQVVLEDGTSDTIPSTTDRIEVSGSGELTQIDMTVVSNIELITLTPMTLINSAVKKGNSIDFSDVIMLGTYTATDGITVFRALTVDYFTNTFSKLEKKFTVKIKNDGSEFTEVFKNGSAVNTTVWSSLESQEYDAMIDVDCNKSTDYEPFMFTITVLPETVTEITKFNLTSIDLDLTNAKKDYKVGDTLDLRGLVVWGTYTSDSFSYTGLVTDWTALPANGSKLTEAGTITITITAAEDQNLSKTFDRTVKDVYVVTFVKDAGDAVNGTIVQNIVQGEKAADPGNPTKTGYTFDGWHKQINGTTVENGNYNFDSDVDGNITLIAKWNPKQYTVTLWNDGDVSGDPSVTATYDTMIGQIDIPSKIGYTFDGYWTETNGQGEQYIDASGVGVRNWTTNGTGTLYAKWNIIPYTITYDNTKDVTNTNDTTYDIEHLVTLLPLTKTGWRFDGWFKVNGDDTTEDRSTDVWNNNKDQTGDVTFRAGWTAKWDTDTTGDFVYGDTVYSKTGMIQVLSEPTVITCDQSGGVFPTSRSSVTLGKYAIGKYEVTQQFYEAVMEISQSDIIASINNAQECGIGDYNPVYYVSWYDAIVFCNKLSTLMNKTPCYKLANDDYPEDHTSDIPTTGAQNNNSQNWSNMKCNWSADGYRLPTECEWECAARGGNQNGDTWNYPYAGADDKDVSIDAVAVYSTSSTSPVGSKNPITQDFKVYDMSGNVWEWCWDYYQSTISSTPVTGPKSGSDRMIRGGRWGSAAQQCEVSYRYYEKPYVRNDRFGFRLVCSGE